MVLARSDSDSSKSNLKNEGQEQNWTLTWEMPSVPLRVPCLISLSPSHFIVHQTTPSLPEFSQPAARARTQSLPRWQMTEGV